MRDAVGVLADGSGGRGVYAIGGAVRDVLLGRAVHDLDLATEVDAIGLVRSALPGARVAEHRRFRTATVRVDGVRIDLATCRSETYGRPGALPRVTQAPIEHDLRRRDFGVNALALRLDGMPELLDPCGGLDDLRERRIRVLHEASFRDDATRVFRAFRYAARLGFALDAGTLTLLERDVSYVDSVGGERLRRELELLIAEETGSSALADCDGAGAVAAVHPALAWPSGAAAALADPSIPRIPLGFALLASSASVAGAEEIVVRLRLKRDQAAAVRGIAALRPLVATLRRPTAKPSGVVVLLDRYPPAAVAAFAGTRGDEIAGRLALRYLAEWRDESTILRGDDLIALGVPPGPMVQRGLRLIRASRLDGWASDRDDERALALRFAKSIRDSGAANAESTLEPESHGP